MASVERYLLPSEKTLVLERRHWAVMLGSFVKVGGTWLGLLALAVLLKSDFTYYVAMFFLIFALLYLVWVVAEWWYEQFVVTNRRILLLRGLIVHNLGIMPLSKVTDLTYERDPLGRLLGYGTFIIESAGQDQALSRIDYVNHPDYWYTQMTKELFGGAAALDVRLVDIDGNLIGRLEPGSTSFRPPWSRQETTVDLSRVRQDDD